MTFILIEDVIGFYYSIIFIVLLLRTSYIDDIAINNTN